MPNLYQYVRPGTKFSQSAVATNAMIDAAVANKKKPTGISFSKGELPLGMNFVLIQNNTSSVVPRYSAMSIETPLLTPDENDSAYRSRIAFTGDIPSVPDDVGKFAILWQPLAAGQVGRAVINGPALTQVNISDASHGFADVADGSTTLASGSSGAATILWKADDSGDAVDCLVLLGSGGGTPTFGVGQMGQIITYTTDGSTPVPSFMFLSTPD